MQFAKCKIRWILGPTTWKSILVLLKRKIKGKYLAFNSILILVQTNRPHQKNFWAKNFNNFFCRKLVFFFGTKDENFNSKTFLNCNFKTRTRERERKSTSPSRSDQSRLVNFKRKRSSRLSQTVHSTIWFDPLSRLPHWLGREPRAVGPDWVIFCTLGNHSKPWSTIQCRWQQLFYPNCPHC